MLQDITIGSLDCVQLQRGDLELVVTRSVGPRILSLRYQGREDIFAQVPHATLECPGAGRLYLWGGHRLWHAPEVARRTYLPDDRPVDIHPDENGLLVIQPLEVKTGIQKSLRIRIDGHSVIVDHQLHNRGYWPVECAAWAITQLRPGGVAIMPHARKPADPDGLQPNRAVALWPYTDISSHHIRWGNHYTLIAANMTSGALKLGIPNSRGWLAYHYRDMTFVKQSAFDPQSMYYDFGASSQIYCCADFLELETLSPRQVIEPDQTLVHRETWTLYLSRVDLASEGSIDEMVQGFGLDLFV